MTTRAQLVRAVKTASWDLLDRLLAEDSRHLDDNALFGDDWGDWWGMLLQCVYDDEIEGVRVLLAHGARRDLVRWGDAGYPPHTPLEAALEGRRAPAIVALLQDPQRPLYHRGAMTVTAPEPTCRDAALNRQGEIRDETGLIFPV